MGQYYRRSQFVNKPEMNSRQCVFIALITSIVSLSACVYRVDIPQGNRVEASAIAQLEPGMSRRQVEFLLGEPAIIDRYHPDTWFYIHYAKSGETGSVEKQVMTLRFDGDLLATIEGTLTPE